MPGRRPFLDAYRHLVTGLSRSLLIDPHHANARTVGDTNVQLQLDAEPGRRPTASSTDRPTKPGLPPGSPTPEADAACAYRFGRAIRLLCADGQIAGAVVRDGVSERVVAGPLRLLRPGGAGWRAYRGQRTRGDDPLRLDPALGGIRRWRETSPG
jgi:hypothetical protein